MDPSDRPNDAYNTRRHQYDTRLRRGSDMSSDPVAHDLHKDFQRVFSFTHDMPVLHREPTDLRLAKHQPLPAIGMSVLPERLDEEEKNEINQQSSRFISAPSPPALVPSKRLHESSKLELADSPKTRRTKVKLNHNNRRKRFESRRVTAGVQLPPIKRSTRQWGAPGALSESYDSDYIYEIPERPEAPAPNRTPPLDGAVNRNSCQSLDDDEPIDYIDED